MATVEEFQRRLASIRPRDLVALTVQRAGAGAAPAPVPSPPAPGVGTTRPVWPDLSWLQNLPADARFSRFMGFELSVRDQSGSVTTFQAIPGTVTEVDGARLTLRPNNPQHSAGPYTVGPATTLVGPRLQAGLDHLQPGDRVVVVVPAGSATPHAVVAVGAATST